MTDIIHPGDTTSHGSMVTEAFDQIDFNGRSMAGIGHQVACPLCKETFPITEGSVLLDMNGVPVALHGMRTACGASLIASGLLGTVEN